MNCNNQNLDLLIFLKSVLNRGFHQIDINQRQNKDQLIDLKDKIKNDSEAQNKMTFKAMQWDLELREFKKTANNRVQ